MPGMASPLAWAKPSAPDRAVTKGCSSWRPKDLVGKHPFQVQPVEPLQQDRLEPRTILPGQAGGRRFRWNRQHRRTSIGEGLREKDILIEPSQHNLLLVRVERGLLQQQADHLFPGLGRGDIRFADRVDQVGTGGRLVGLHVGLDLPTEGLPVLDIGGLQLGRTLAIGQAGATNAALFAASILANKYEPVRSALDKFRADQTATVLANPDPSITAVSRP